jgi:hypothetical protein
MPNFGFFSAKEDIPLIADYLLRTGCRLFPSRSAVNENLVEITTTLEVCQLSTPAYGGSVFLMVYIPGSGGQVRISRIDIKSREYQPGDYYYLAEGWGMPLLVLNIEDHKKQTLSASNLGCNSESRASFYDSTYTHLGKASEWEWPVIEKYQSALKYHFSKKLAVEKIGPRLLLPGASTVHQSGYKLLG